MSSAEPLRLWTWQNPECDITSQGWSCHKLNSDWGEEMAGKLLRLYKKLWDILGTRDFVWCFLEYEHWKQCEIRRLWVLQVPRSQVLRYVKSPVWECLLDQDSSKPIPDSLWRGLLLSEDEAVQYLGAGRSSDITVLLKVPIERERVVDSERLNKGPGSANAKYADLPTRICEARRCRPMLGRHNGPWAED